MFASSAKVTPASGSPLTAVRLPASSIGALLAGGGLLLAEGVVVQARQRLLNGLSRAERAGIIDNFVATVFRSVEARPGEQPA